MPADKDEAAAAAAKERRTAAGKLRDQLRDRLEAEGASDLVSRLDKCGNPVSLTCTNCGGSRQVESACRARWCPSCAPLVAIERRAKWEAAVKTIRWPLFVTLTMPNSLDPESLRRLRRCWGNFRRRKLWREKVAGGIGTFEVTNKGKGWHPHVHAILDCRWLSLNVREPHRRDSPETVAEKCRLAQAELSASWADCIGEPEGIVWVTRVPPGAVVDYVLKYGVKGSELLAAPDQIAPMIRVLAKTRALSGFGSLFPLDSPDEDPGPGCACETCQATGQWMPTDVVHYLTATGNAVDPRPAIPFPSARLRKTNTEPERPR